MSFLNLLLGKPLANWEEKGERIGPAAGIPIFGLDALSSAAYGPEAALTILIPLGALGVAYIVPISGAIILLLTIVLFLLSPNHRCIPWRRRIVHRCARKHWRGRGSVSGRRAADRLRADGGGWNLGRRGRAGVGVSLAAAAHAGACVSEFWC